MLDHGAVVACDIGLALRAVYQHGLDLVAADCVKLCPDGERRAAETDDAALAHGLKKAVKIMHVGSLQLWVGFHPAVALDADRLSAAIRLNGLDSAGNACVNGGRVLSLLARDKLAAVHMLPDLDDRHGRLTGVHIHRKQYLGARRYRL